MLYHITTKRAITMLTPHIPKTMKNDEEDKTPRICFAPSINCCLRAISEDGANITYDANDYTKTNLIITLNNGNILTNLINGSNSGNALLSNLIYDDESVQYPVYHAYMPYGVTYNEFYIPTVDEVFDQQYTQEVWLTKPCHVIRAFSFAVINVSVIQEIKLFNYKIGKYVDYQVKDYVIQVLPKDILDKYISLNETIKRDQIELFKLRNQLSRGNL